MPPFAESSTKKAERGIANLFSSCPQSATGVDCSQCALERSPKDRKWVVHCHCGSNIILINGQIQSTRVHWSQGQNSSEIHSEPNIDRSLTHIEPAGCKKQVQENKTQPQIGAFFSKKRPEPQHEPKAEEEAHRWKAWQTTCAGLNENTWNQPKSPFLIINCILGSPSVHHGVPRHDHFPKKLQRNQQR